MIKGGHCVFLYCGWRGRGLRLHSVCIQYLSSSCNFCVNALCDCLQLVIGQNAISEIYPVISGQKSWSIFDFLSRYYYSSIEAGCSIIACMQYYSCLLNNISMLFVVMYDKCLFLIYNYPEIDETFLVLWNICSVLLCDDTGTGRYAYTFCLSCFTMFGGLVIYIFYHSFSSIHFYWFPKQATA